MALHCRHVKSVVVLRTSPPPPHPPPPPPPTHTHTRMSNVGTCRSWGGFHYIQGKTYRQQFLKRRRYKYSRAYRVAQSDRANIYLPVYMPHARLFRRNELSSFNDEKKCSHILTGVVPVVTIRLLPLYIN